MFFGSVVVLDPLIHCSALSIQAVQVPMPSGVTVSDINSCSAWRNYFNGWSSDGCENNTDIRYLWMHQLLNCKHSPGDAESIP